MYSTAMNGWGETMEVIYHAGMHKTGTTFVQMWLKDNRDKLLSEGTWVFIPETLGPLVLLRGDALVAKLQELVEAVRLAGGKRIIISHEGISFFDRQRIALLARAIPNVRTRCILTIRHWNGFLPSRWKQNVSRADSQSFGKMVARLRDPESVSINLRFDLLVQCILDAGFDTNAIVSYDRAAKDGGILQAVLEAADISPPKDAISRPNRINESLDILSTDIVRLFNGIRARAEGLLQNPLHDAREDPSIRPHYFDHNRHLIVDVMHRSFPEIVERLSQAEPTVLRAADFLPIAARLEALVAPFVVNPTQGCLFPDTPDRDVCTSPLELEDLPPVVTEKILLAVKEGAAR
jgi:hypothetical protein